MRYRWPPVNHLSGYSCPVSSLLTVTLGLGHVICFGQWNISKHNKNRDSITACPQIVGLALFNHCLDINHRAGRKPKLATWTCNMAPWLASSAKPDPLVNPPAKCCHVSDPKQTLQKNCWPSWLTEWWRIISVLDFRAVYYRAIDHGNRGSG